MTCIPTAAVPAPGGPPGAPRPGALTAREVTYAAFVAERRGTLLRTALLLSGGDADRAEALVRGALTRLYLVWPWVGPHGPLARARQLLLDAAVAEAPRLQESPGTAGPDLVTALAGLPPRTRLAVVLRDVEHLGEAEVADVLSCSLHSLRRLALAGRLQVRTALAALPVPGGGRPTRAPATGPTTAPGGPTMTDPDLTALLRGAAERLPLPVTGPADVPGDLDRGRRTLVLVRRRRAGRPGLPAGNRPAGAGS